MFVITKQNQVTDGAKLQPDIAWSFVPLRTISSIVTNHRGTKLLSETRSVSHCDGFAVNTGYFSIHPNVGGTFNNTTEIHDHKKHPITFRFRALAKLRRLIEHIAVDIEGLADTSGYIDEFIDVEEDSINTHYLPGNQFIIHGHKIKAVGDDPSVGVYFVPVNDPSKTKKATRIAENTSTKIIGIAPGTGSSPVRIEIHTQFEGSATRFLKNVRIITSGFTVEEN